MGQQRLPGFQDASLQPRKISPDLYNAALAATGLDRSTLATYACVARRVSSSLRNKHLSWEHHKAVVISQNVMSLAPPSSSLPNEA